VVINYFRVDNEQDNYVKQVFLLMNSRSINVDWCYSAKLFVCRMCLNPKP